jgi:hypothetical protein
MKYLTYIILGVFFLQSCEDPIDVTLEDADNLLVVDAWLNNRSEIQQIRLGFTSPYFDNSLTPGIDDAVVTVSSSNGDTFEFNNQGGNGNYQWIPSTGETLGEIGTEYTLNISLNGINYSSTTSMNRVPEIDSITQEFIDDDPFRDDGIYTEFISTDIPGLDDTYWIKTFKNGQYLNKPEEINIAYDAGFDGGGDVDGIVFISPIRFLTNEIDDDGMFVKWEPGEEIRIEIHSISNEAFGFMEIGRDQLLNGSNGIFAEPLANTRGNVNADNGDMVLGVFNVAAISSAEHIIQ